MMCDATRAPKAFSMSGTFDQGDAPAVLSMLDEMVNRPRDAEFRAPGRWPIRGILTVGWIYSGPVTVEGFQNQMGPDGMIRSSVDLLPTDRFKRARALYAFGSRLIWRGRWGMFRPREEIPS